MKNTIYQAIAVCAFLCGQPQRIIVHDNARLRLESSHRLINSEESKETPFGFLSGGHDVVYGDGLVIELKTVGENTIGRTDSGSTEDVSIYLDHLYAKKSNIDLDLSGKDGSHILVFYSHYNNSFLGNSGCYGYANTGHISIKRNGKNISLKITASIYTHDPSNLRECKKIAINGNYMTVM